MHSQPDRPGVGPGTSQEMPPSPGGTAFQVVVTVLMLLVGLAVYRYLPHRIPLHWGIRGQIDRWGDRNLVNVFFPVAIAAGVALLAWLLPRIDPLKSNYLRFKDSYSFIIDLIVVFLAFVYVLTLYAALNPRVPVGVLVPLGVGLLLALIGNQLSKVKRNFFMGIRTPWTLASEEVWGRTHRFGARAMVTGGLISAATAFLPPPYNFLAFLTVILLTTLGTVVASYFIYKRLEAMGGLGDVMRGPDQA